MLLAFNIGNTEIAFGVIDTESGAPRFSAALAARPARSADEYSVLLGQIFALNGIEPATIPTVITDVIIASVVPALLDAVRAAVARLTPVRTAIVGPGMRTGLQIRIDSPTQLGADLVALAAGARHRRDRFPAVVVSMDTATTLTVLGADCAVCGVVILPGVGSSAAALDRDAALLTQIPLTPPRRVIGRNTAESIRSGLFWGAAAQIDGLCDRIEDELSIPHGALTVLLTGSYAARVAPLSRRRMTLAPSLIFEGLYALWQINRQSPSPQQAPHHGV